MIGFSPRRSLTAHHDWKEVLETLRAKFHKYVFALVSLPRHGTNRYFSVKLPKSFVAINLSEKVPDAFDERRANGKGKEKEGVKATKEGTDTELVTPPGLSLDS